MNYYEQVTTQKKKKNGRRIQIMVAKYLKTYLAMST